MASSQPPHIASGCGSWLDYYSLQSEMDQPITAACVVGDTVWLGDARGQLFCFRCQYTKHFVAICLFFLKTTCRYVKYPDVPVPLPLRPRAGRSELGRHPAPVPSADAPQSRRRAGQRPSVPLSRRLHPAPVHPRRRHVRDERAGLGQRRSSSTLHGGHLVSYQKVTFSKSISNYFL